MQSIIDHIKTIGYWRSDPHSSHDNSVRLFLGALLHRGMMNTFCLSTVAEFLVSNEKLIVISRNTVQFVDCVGPRLRPATNITNAFEGDLTGLCCIPTSTLVCGVGGVHTVSDGLSGVGEVKESVKNVLCISSTPRGSYFATGSSNGTVSVWASATQCPLHHLNGHTDWVRFVQFSKGLNPGLQLFSAGDDGTVCQWDPLDGALLSRVDYARGQNIQLLEVSYYSGIMALSCGTPIVALYTCSSNRVTRKQGDELLRLEPIGLISASHQYAAISAKFTEDSQWIATTAEDETVALSSVTEPRRTFVCSEFTSKRRCLTFMNTFTSVHILASPPFSSVIIIAACANDGAVIEWIVDPRSGKSFYTKKIQLHLGPLLSIACTRC